MSGKTHITEKRLHEISGCFADKTIAVAGDLMLDVYVEGKATRISQEAPVPVLKVREVSRRLGGASNVMKNITALGGKAEAVGAAGDDGGAETLKALMREASIGHGNVLTLKNRRTTEKQRVIASPQQIVRIDFEDDSEFPAETRDEMLRRLRALTDSGNISAVIFEDYAKGALSRGLIEEAARAAAKKGIFTALDPHPTHPMNIKGLSLMTPNRSEAFGLAGVYARDAAADPEKDKALADVAKRLQDLWEPEFLLITLGAKGMALFEKNGGLTVIPTRAREVFDVSGAGDTVIAAFTLARICGAEPAEAADIANHAAGIVVGKIGTATVTVDELKLSFLQNRD